MKKIFSLIGLVVFISASNATNNNNEPSKYFRLLPKPQKIEWFKGKGIFPHSIQGISLQGMAKKPVLYGSLQSLPNISVAFKSILVLKLSKSADIPSSDEGYVLEVKAGNVYISARKQEGLFYGCQTLNQLLEDAIEQNIEIPSCKITDYPEQPYRAVHLDLKHHLDAGHYYYEIIDRLAQIKVNAIIVEFEDKLRYRKAPIVGSGNAISVVEFAAISRYAHERNIEISPLVQGLGHASFILKHKEYNELRDNPASDWAFDALNPKTYELQFSLYEDAIAATPYGKYLHVGGDEVGNLGMSELSKKSGLTPIQLQMKWLNKVTEFARLHHRIPIFWDDMLFKLAGLYQTTWDIKVPAEKVKKIWQENAHRLEDNINLFPKECVYMRWNYDHPEIIGNHRAIDWYKSHDLTVMAATAAQTMWPLLPRNHSNFQPIKNFCKISSEKKLEGILCTAWDDCSPHFETYWRGFYDFAFFSWNYIDAEADDVHAIFRHRFYAAALSDQSFEFQDPLEKALDFWETALIEKGHRNNYPDSIHLITLPDPLHPDNWNNKYAKKITKAKEEAIRYEQIKSKIINAQRMATRNHYSLDVFNQINELQVYPSKLLLFLSAYDAATSVEDKKSMSQQVHQLVNNFQARRQRFEEVYSATRFISNPQDYILDQNGHHHLANGTLNSDWMYVFELAMNRKLENWEPVK